MWNKHLKYLLLVIMPLVLIVTANYLDNARGPYWLGSNLDPEYVYLLNSLNLARWQGVGHIDHPGTPVQILGAVTIRVVHYFSAPLDVDLQTHVLTFPEFYLNSINNVLTAINVLMLLLLGIGTTYFARSIWSGLWIQMAVFFSPITLQFGLTRVTPEPLLFFAAMAMVLWLFYYLHHWRRASEPKRGQFIPILLAAVITGLGVATKITFIPMMAVPFLLIPRLRNKLLYLGASVAGFVIFTLPIIRMYPQFFGWIKNLLTHSGQYGGGPSGLISSGKYFRNMGRLLAGDPFFATTLFIAVFIIVASLLVPKIRNNSLSNLFFRGLVALTTAQMVGLIMVSKHSAGHYLLPELNLSGAILLFASFHIYRILSYYKPGIKPSRRYIVIALLVFIAVVLFYPPGRIAGTAKRLTGIKEKSLALHDVVQRDYAEYARIYYYRSSAQEYGLKFGCDLSRSYHAETLQRLYKDVYFYDIWTNRFTPFDYDKNIKFKALRAKYGDKIVFIGTRGVKVPGIRLTEVHHQGTEGIFEIQ